MIRTAGVAIKVVGGKRVRRPAIRVSDGQMETRVIGRLFL